MKPSCLTLLPFRNFGVILFCLNVVWIDCRTSECFLPQRSHRPLSTNRSQNQENSGCTTLYIFPKMGSYVHSRRRAFGRIHRWLLFGADGCIPALGRRFVNFISIMTDVFNSGEQLPDADAFGTLLQEQLKIVCNSKFKQVPQLQLRWRVYFVDAGDFSIH